MVVGQLGIIIISISIITTTTTTTFATFNHIGGFFVLCNEDYTTTTIQGCHRRKEHLGARGSWRLGAGAHLINTRRTSHH